MTDDIENHNISVEDIDNSTDLDQDIIISSQQSIEDIVEDEGGNLRSISTNTKVDDEFEYVTYRRKKKSDNAKRNIAIGQRRRWQAKKDKDEQIIKEKQSIEEQLEQKKREIEALRELLEEPKMKKMEQALPSVEKKHGVSYVNGRIVWY